MSAATQTDWSQYEEKPQAKAAPADDWSQYEDKTPAAAIAPPEHPPGWKQPTMGPTSTAKRFGSEVVGALKSGLTAKFPYVHPLDVIGGLSDAAANTTGNIENYTPRGREEHPILSRVGDLTRGIKDYAGIVGPEVALLGLPEAGGAEGLPAMYGKAQSLVGGGVPAAGQTAVDLAKQAPATAAKVLRTPEGKLRPIAKLGARIAGAGVGYATHLPEAGWVGALSGPALLDALAPERAFEASPELIGRARNEMYNEKAQALMRRGREEDAFARGRSLIAGPEGSAAKPFEPMIWESPEEAAAHDFRMKNIERQASSAGKYHAAQGASGKKTNLQQRIARKENR